jgi:FKBP-type peptidyl-prolyl cis-trans isomerase FkpA
MKHFLIPMVALILFGCAKSSDTTNSQDVCTTYDSCSVKAPASEIALVEQYLTSQNITATKHCSGLYYRIETVGTGTITPTICSAIQVKYVGKLTNGSVFDQNDSYSQYLYKLIPGWINGIPYIRKGGKIHLYVPPTLGYGSTAAGSIPANSVLIFEVELLNNN